MRVLSPRYWCLYGVVICLKVPVVLSLIFKCVILLRMLVPWSAAGVLLSVKSVLVSVKGRSGWDTIGVPIRECKSASAVFLM